PFAHAYPDVCPVCRYEVRKEQPADFEREYQGDDHLGITTTIDEQYEYSRELAAKERAAKVGIIVPRSI
ncbi:MAG TPA: hypothetical protein VLA89_07850, partial [Gemmatimonadales bacterium]|nr:hypothetical protein [Gemmatimonadales bacterium]